MKRAAGGADIGIIVGGQVVALRPVPVVAADYAWTEYGLTPDEMDRIAKKIDAENEKGTHRRPPTSPLKITLPAPLRVVLEDRAIAGLEKLPPEDHAEVVASVSSHARGLWRPHVHAGLGLRQLRSGIYEGRSRLRWRFVSIKREGDTLVVKMVGNHDDVRRWLRQRL